MGFIISKPQTSVTPDSTVLEKGKPEEQQKPEEQSKPEEQQKKEPSEELLKKLEEDSYKKIISNKCAITGEGLQKILQSGFDEFKDNTGRNMTYSEMRRLYG